MKAKNVRGFMIKKERLGISDSETLRQMVLAVNESIDMQGNREITLNREKLSIRIYELTSNVCHELCKWDDLTKLLKEHYLRQADYIISAEADILESPTKGY